MSAFGTIITHKKVKMSQPPTTQSQYVRLVALMAQRPDIARSASKTSEEDVQNFWENLAIQLNTIGPPFKDVTAWKTAWIAYKGYVKRKLDYNISLSNVSSSSGSRKQNFNNLEEKVMKLCAMSMPMPIPGTRSFGLSSNDESKKNTTNITPTLMGRSFGVNNAVKDRPAPYIKRKPKVHSLGTNNSPASESNATNNSPTPMGRSFGVYNNAESDRTSNTLCEAAISRDNLDSKQTVPEDLPSTSKENDAGSRDETNETSIRALLQMQINMQQQFYKDSMEISKRNEQKVDEIATGLDLLSRANETLIEAQKEMLLEMRRHNMVMENFKQEEINLSILMGFDRI